MKRMLINATHGEELRVAVVDGQRLEDLDIEHGDREQQKSNIYKGKVTRIEQSLEAVFVDYGAERHGFLPFKEVARSYLSDAGDGGKPSVKDGLKEGQEILVQIEKEERGTKGAALTTYISLAGRFLVLMPNNARAGGVSRRIEGEDRNELRQVMAEVEVPDGMGVIARTAGVGRSLEEMQWDLDYQAEVWHSIQAAAESRAAPFLVYQESNVIVRALRDYFHSDIGEILIDQPELYQEAKGFVEVCMPHNARKLKLYEDSTPLFTRYQIEQQIESAFQREVTLPSGGAIVIDHTEALVSVDVNSARATKGADIEETATNTNLEAASELARQLRLRDLGGLLVIDFIDMSANRNQKAVENRLREALKVDRARVQVGRISRFGLLEMSRQRLRPSLGDSFQEVCPRCSGQGAIRTVGSLSLSILRLIEDEAMKDNTGQVVAQVPMEVASLLLNEKRDQLDVIESRSDARVLVVPNPYLETPQYRLERIRRSEMTEDTQNQPSYAFAERPADPSPETASEQRKGETAAVRTVVPQQPAPSPASDDVVASVEAVDDAQPGLIRRAVALVGRMMGGGSAAANAQDAPDSSTPAKRPAQRNRSDAKRGDGRRGDGRRGDARHNSNGQRDDKRQNNRGSRADGRRNSGRQDDKRQSAKDNGERKRDSAARDTADSAKSSNDSRNGASRGRGRRGGRGSGPAKSTEPQQATSTDTAAPDNSAPAPGPSAAGAATAAVTAAAATAATSVESPRTGPADADSAMPDNVGDVAVADTVNGDAEANQDAAPQSGNGRRRRRGGRGRRGRNRGERAAEGTAEPTADQAADTSPSTSSSHAPQGAADAAPAASTPSGADASDTPRATAPSSGQATVAAPPVVPPAPMPAPAVQAVTPDTKPPLSAPPASVARPETVVAERQAEPGSDSGSA
ncbi:MAG: Rne/Rng family ribonuclease [Pseudomonadota bacterium]